MQCTHTTSAGQSLAFVKNEEKRQFSILVSTRDEKLAENERNKKKKKNFFFKYYYIIANIYSYYSLNIISNFFLESKSKNHAYVQLGINNSANDGR